MNIAIDGPSGAGKSTVAKKLALQTGMLYLDTGAMYRAIGLKAYNLGIDIKNEAEVVKMLEKTDIKVLNSVFPMKIFLDGEDVSEKIREHHISKYASEISAHPEVRLKMVDLQRKIAAESDCILDGRDIGTYVLPHAEVKIFLSASVEERAKRRFSELREKGYYTNYEEIKQDIIDRDFRDTHRSFAPLKKADDATEIDSTSMSVDDVVNFIVNLIKSKGKKL